MSAQSLLLKLSNEAFPIQTVVVLGISDAVLVEAHVLSAPGVVHALDPCVEDVFNRVDHVCDVVSIFTVSDLLVNDSNSNT